MSYFSNREEQWQEYFFIQVLFVFVLQYDILKPQSPGISLHSLLKTVVALRWLGSSWMLMPAPVKNGD
jgi:hypothetical protein